MRAYRQEGSAKSLLLAASYDVGIYQSRQELISALRERGCRVSLSLPPGEMTEAVRAIADGFIETKMDRRGMNPFKDIALLCRYFMMLRRLRPDFVITYAIKPNIYCGLACALLAIPYGANITGLGTAFQRPGFVRGLAAALCRMGLRRARVVFTENAANRDTIVGLGIVEAARCHVLMGAGVNLTRYAPLPYPAQGGELRFLFVGRLMAEKGIYELLQAAKRLLAEGENIGLDLVGPREESLREEGGCPQIRFHGFQADVRPFIGKAHCFVLPSYHEGMSNTLLESAASGRPLITSDIPGCREAVLPNESGFLVPPGDGQALYEAMKAFIALPQAERAAMGQRARAHMEACFDKSAVVEETLGKLGL